MLVMLSLKVEHGKSEEAADVTLREAIRTADDYKIMTAMADMWQQHGSHHVSSHSPTFRGR